MSHDGDTQPCEWRYFNRWVIERVSLNGGMSQALWHSQSRPFPSTLFHLTPRRTLAARTGYGKELVKVIRSILRLFAE